MSATLNSHDKKNYLKTIFEQRRLLFKITDPELIRAVVFSSIQMFLSVLSSLFTYAFKLSSACPYFLFKASRTSARNSSSPPFIASWIKLLWAACGKEEFGLFCPITLFCFISYNQNQIQSSALVMTTKQRLFSKNTNS